MTGRKDIPACLYFLNMKVLSLLFIITLATSGAFGQEETYNKRLSLGFNNLIFRSVELTDTCFIISGVGRDSFPGSFFSRFDFSGNPIYFKLNKANDQLIRTWGRDLQEFGENQWIVSGEGADSTGGYVIILTQTSQGDTLKIVRFYHPDHPQEQFIVSSAGLARMGNKWFLQMNIFNSMASPPSNALFLAKLDQDLAINWTKLYESSKDETSRSVLAFGQNLLIGAWRTNFNTNIKSFNTQLYFLQIDTLNGDINKTLLYPYTPTNQLLMGPADDMLVEEDGSLIVATRKGKEIVVGSNGHIFWDGEVLKVNPALNSVQWTCQFRAYQNSPLTQFYKIVMATGGDGYLTAGVGILDSIHIGALLAKVSLEGDSLWMRQYMYVTTPSCYNVIYDLEPTPDGGYVMVGEARPYNALDTLFPPPVQQGWILKVDEWGCLVPGCQLGVATKDAPAGEDMALKVYPNPAFEVLYIHLPNAGPEGRFRFVDILGRTIREFAASPGDTTYILPLEGIPAGWYVLQYEEGGRRLAVSVYRL